MRDRGDDQRALILKADEGTVKEVINTWREQETVFPVQPLFVIQVSPRLAMARNQMNQIVNAGDPALFLDLDDTLLE